MPQELQEYKLADVFGVSRDIPLTYTPREYVDQLFVNSLARDKHIVVYGGSKQGKTCLRKHALMPEDYIVFQCSNTTTPSQIYTGVLKEAGAAIDVIEKRTTKGDWKVRVEFSATGSVPLIAKGEAKAGGEFGKTTEISTESRFLEIDPTEPNDIIRILTEMSFNKFVVLEDFHYLTEEVQRQIAMDLKAFHEKSKICFIVVGVWVESNRLVMYNGDLAGRLIPVDVDRWESDDLNYIFDAGESLLNIQFTTNIRSVIISLSQGNVGILQETCYRLCESHDINFTQKSKTVISDSTKVSAIIDEYAKEQRGRYQNFLSKFIEGFLKSDLEMYKWIVYILINSNTDELKKGIKAFDIFTRMQQVHPYRDRLLYNNAIQALKNCSKLQNQNGVRPIILDFDFSENELKVVDSGFILFLASHDKQALLQLIGLNTLPNPIEIPESGA